MWRVVDTPEAGQVTDLAVARGFGHRATVSGQEQRLGAESVVIASSSSGLFLLGESSTGSFVRGLVRSGTRSFGDSVPVSHGESNRRERPAGKDSVR